MNFMQKTTKLSEVDALISDEKVSRLGMIILVLTFGVLGVWSAFAPINSAALAPGYVAVKNNSKTVQHLEGGIVDRLLIEEGSIVTKGDVLIELDDTQIKAQRDITQAQYVVAKSMEARLIAEQAKLDEVVYPAKLLAEPNNRTLKAIKAQNDIFTSRVKAREGEQLVLEQRIGQLNSKYGGLSKQRESNRALSRSLKEEVVELEELLEKGFADKRLIREKTREQLRAQSLMAELSASLAQTKIQTGETKLQILQLEKEAEKEIATELASVQAQVFDLTEKNTALEDRLSRVLIRAPITGKVLNLAAHTEGGIISPREPILELVPEGGELTVIARLSPNDIDRVHIGFEGEIRFSAFNQKTTPMLFARIVKLSADRLVDKQTGAPYYQVELELLADSVTDIANLELLPGMPAEVIIETGERTLFEYLAKPVSDAFQRSFLEE